MSSRATAARMPSKAYCDGAPGQANRANSHGKSDAPHMSRPVHMGGMRTRSLQQTSGEPGEMQRNSDVPV